MARIDATKHRFSDVEVFGKPMLFTVCRVDVDTIPHGLFKYEIRTDDYGLGEMVEIRESILVNHGGTLISATPIELDIPGLYQNYRSINEDDDIKWFGIGSTIEEYMRRMNHEAD